MKTVKKLSSIATMFIFVAASFISCDKDEDNATTEQPIDVPTNLSGIVELDSYKIDFGTYKSTAPKASKAINKQQVDTTIVLTLTNGSSLDIKKLSSSVDINGGGVSASLKSKRLKPGESLQVPYTYIINTNTPGVKKGTASLTPTFENDSIGKPLEASISITIE